MGSPPPPDAPSPEEQDTVSVSAGFQPGPPAASLCKFKLPSFLFSISFKLPSLNIGLPSLPSFSLSLGLNCDLSNPVNVSAGISFGGGRKPTGQPNPDDQDTTS